MHFVVLYISQILILHQLKQQLQCISPVHPQGKQKLVFLGYINDLHYVSTVQNKSGLNKSSLTHLKTKLTMNKEKKQNKLAYYSVYQNRKLRTCISRN